MKAQSSAYKKVEGITYAEEFQMGVMRVKQPLPSPGLTQVSPFLLLHHAGPMKIEPGSANNRISPHPHRGFEPVTFVYEGEIFHRDSLKNEGRVGAGGVQWMTAGKGVVHSEGPSPELVKSGGTLEIIQLWINLPKKDKMSEPSYQDISGNKIPVIEKDNGNIKLALVAGEYNGFVGPAKTKTPMLIMNGKMEEGSETEIELNEGFNTVLYLLNGTLFLNENESLENLHLVIFGKENSGIKIRAGERSRFLLLSGEPIEEPMVQYGPFVMNTNKELQQAILDYQNGEMGELDY